MRYSLALTMSKYERLRPAGMSDDDDEDDDYYLEKVQFI